MNFEFYKSFTTGFKNGLSILETMTFVDESYAREWMDSINAKNNAGDVDYHVHAMKSVDTGEYVL